MFYTYMHDLSHHNYSRGGKFLKMSVYDRLLKKKKLLNLVNPIP